jgi:hypothetical protein
LLLPRPPAEHAVALVERRRTRVGEHARPVARVRVHRGDDPAFCAVPTDRRTRW